MAEQFANLISNTLAVAQSASSSGASETLTLASSTGFPATGTFRIRVGTEIELVTANPGSNQLTVTRGQEGTTAGAHPIGTPVTVILTAAALLQYAKDVLARIGVSAPLTIGFDGTTGNPTVALPAASGSQDGYLSSANWTKLNGIDTGAQVNVIELINGSAPITASAISAKQQTIGITPASAVAAGSLSAAHFSLLNGATDAATANALVRRNSTGDATFRYAFAAYFNSTTNENRTDQPDRLMGRVAGDNFIRDYNPYNTTVGAARALVAGYADKTKLDGIYTGLSGPDANGWYFVYLPNGSRRYFRTLQNQGFPALAEATLATFNPPVGYGWINCSGIQAQGICANGQSVMFGLRFWNGSASSGDVNQAQMQLMARDHDGINLNTRSALYSAYVELII